MSTGWRDLLIYAEGEAEEPTTFGERLAFLRQEAASGRFDAAFDEALELAVGLHRAGLDLEALELLDDLRSFVRQSDVEPERWPWFFNTRGMALSGLGRHKDAEAEYHLMRELAEKLTEGPVARDIASTALQNLGITVVEADEPARAVPLLREALSIKKELEDWTSTVDVLNSLALAVAQQGELDQAERILSDVEDISLRLQDRRRLGAAFGNRGNVRTRRGDYIGAEKDFRTALRYARSEGDPLRELLGMMNIGSSLADQGRAGEALRWYRRAARWAAERGSATVELRLRRSTALMLLRMARPRDALPEMNRALELANEIGHARYGAECRADLGALHIEVGDYDQAREDLLAAQQAFAVLGDRVWQARVVRNLAELALSQNEISEAEPRWSEAIALLGDGPETAAAIARRAAEAWIDERDTDTAARWLAIELDLARRFEGGGTLAWRTATAGALLNLWRRNEHGLHFLEDAVDRYEQLQDLRQATRVRLDLATALSDLDRHQDAIAHLELCLEFADECSDRVLRESTLANLGEVTRRAGDLDRAHASLDEAVTLSRVLSDDDSLAHALGNIGLVQCQIGDYDSARNSFAEQLELAKKLRSTPYKANALGGLGNIYFVEGSFARAAAHYRKAAELSVNISEVGVVEDIGGLLQSLAGARRYGDLQEAAQRLVNVAQDTGLEATASGALARTARILLGAGENREAADLYCASIRVRLARTTDEANWAKQTGEVLAYSVGLMAAHVEVDLPEEQRAPFYELVLTSFDDIEEGLGDVLRPILDEVRNGLEQQGIFSQLREDES
jgi:tetratricopeptide (TPR) repeat protein